MFRVLGLLAILAILAGCAESVDIQQRMPIRVGTNVWPGYEPLYLARDMSQWPSSELRLVEFPSASEVLRAFRNKAIDAASLTLDEVLLLRGQNIPVTVVLVHDISLGGDVIIARPEIHTMKELQGKRIGVEAGALGALVVTRALEINGLTLDDITIVNRDVNMHEQAFIDGEVDAVVTFEPVRTRLLERGGNEVFTSREIPGEIVDVLVVHEQILANRPESVRYLVNSWFKTLGFMQKNMSSAATHMARRLKISPDEVISSYEGLKLPDLEENRQMLGGEQPSLGVAVTKLNRIMVANGLLGEQVTEKNIFTAAMLP